MNETLDVGKSEDEKLDSVVDSIGDGVLVPTKAHVPMMAILLDTQVENLSKGFSSWMNMVFVLLLLEQGLMFKIKVST